MDRAADAIIGLYQRHAAAWTEAREAGFDPARILERGWLERFAALLPRPASVLDLGCGGGVPIADWVIARGDALTGIDSSPAMIARCRARFPGHAWQLGDMRGLALGRRFHGILAWDSFFHLRGADQRAMFAVFAAHALPGAALMFTSGPREGIAIGTLACESLFHASLDADEYRALLDAHGFDLVSHVADDHACGGHTVWLARFRITPAARPPGATDR